MSPADTNGDGQPGGRPVLLGRLATCTSGGRRATRRRASPNLRKLREVYLTARKFPLFAGISLVVKFLRFPEIVVASGGRSRI